MAKTAGRHMDVLRLLLLIVGLILLTVLYRIMHISDYLEGVGLLGLIQNIRNLNDDLGIWGPITFWLLGSAAIVVNIPTVIIIAIAAVVYGVVGAIIQGTLCLLTASLLIFVIAQGLGKDYLTQFFHRHTRRFDNYVQHNGLLTVVYVRLVFFALPPANWLLGVMNLRLSEYFLGTLLGGMPHILIWSWAGGAAVRILVDNQGWNIWTAPQLLLPLLFGLFMLGLIQAVQRYVLKNKSTKAQLENN
jgi:uncharacterized membrane protein YdjX (TVP38/TMEM64 family)